MLWLVTDQVKLFIYSPLDSPCLFWADNKVFICLSVPGWSLWSGFNRPTFWMFWSRCDVTHISWRKHQQATSSTIYSTSCWIKEVVMRSPISFDTTRPSVECQMWDVMSKRVNIESLKELFPPRVISSLYCEWLSSHRNMTLKLFSTFTQMDRR